MIHERQYDTGDIVFFKNLKINRETIQHPYIIAKVNISNEDNKKGHTYSVIQITGYKNEFEARIHNSELVEGVRNSVLVFREGEGVEKDSVVRFHPECIVNNVPHFALNKKGSIIGAKAKVTRLKNICKEYLLDVSPSYKDIIELPSITPKNLLIKTETEIESKKIIPIKATSITKESCDTRITRIINEIAKINPNLAREVSSYVTYSKGIIIGLEKAINVLKK